MASKTQPKRRRFRFELGDRVSISLLGKTFTGIVEERYFFNTRNFYHLISDRPGFSLRFVSQAEETLTLLDAKAPPSPANVRVWADAFNQL
jgi:hypothetical protein